MVYKLGPLPFDIPQDWRQSDYVVPSQKDLMQAALPLLCLSLPPEFVDLLLDHHKLLLLLTCTDLQCLRLFS